jgi:6-phosphofructokinase 1
LIDKDKFGKLVVLKGQNIESVALRSAIKGVKNVEPNGQIVKTCESINICLGRNNKYLY